MYITCYLFIIGGKDIFFVGNIMLAIGGTETKKMCELNQKRYHPIFFQVNLFEESLV